MAEIRRREADGIGCGEDLDRGAKQMPEAAIIEG
jgi:hypothetical protein